MSGFLTGVVLITTSTGVRVDLPAPDGTSYQPIQLMLGAGLSGTTVSRTSGLTKVLLTSTGELPALTESGQGFAGSGGFVNLGVTSRGIRGGRDDATQATLLGWDGVTKTLSLGTSGILAFGVIVNSAIRFAADGSLTTFAGPDGDTCKVTLSDTEILLKFGGDERGKVDSAESSLTSPSGGNSVTVTNTTVTIAGDYAFTGGTPPDVTGSKGGNVALGNLLSALAARGLITDSTT